MLRMGEKSRRIEIFDSVCSMIEEVGYSNEYVEELYFDTEFYQLEWEDGNFIDLAFNIQEEFGVDVEQMLLDGQITTIEELVDYIKDNEL